MPLVPVPSARPVAALGPADTAREHGPDPDDGTVVALVSDPAHRARPERPEHPERPAEEVEVLRIVGWPDPVIDRLGFDPRSLYVETFWLGILGPTCTWFLRLVATGLDDSPDGFDLDLATTARALGLGDRTGRQSPFRRTLARCVTFEMARRQGPDTLAVHRRIPPLPRRHLQRLPVPLQERHTHWLIPTRSSPVLEEARRNARRLALALLASDKERSEVEVQLVRWQVHPAIAHEAAQWAWAYRARDVGGGVSRGGVSRGGVSRAGGRRGGVSRGGGSRAGGTGAGGAGGHPRAE